MSNKDELLPDQLETIDQNEEDNPNTTTKISDEDKRLGGSSPLKTICVLSAGPLISQITGALYGVVNTIWISKAIGDAGLTAISTYQNFDTIGRSFASFLQVAATAKISSLFGSGLKNEASQVLSDLLRFSIVCALVAAAVCIPTCRLCVRWFGAEEDIVELGYKYIVPNLCITIIPCIFLIGCGCLQAEGRSWLFSITQVVALVLNMCVFCPLFLLVFKFGIAGAAWATGFAELIPGVVIIILFYKGKFGIQPKWNEMLKKFSPHTYDALKIGLAQLVLMLSFAIPGIIIRKLLGLACNGDPVIFNNVMAGYNAFNRFWTIEGAVPNAINIGFIPAASYAYGAKMNMRVVHLLIHASWIAVLWCSLCMLLTLCWPKSIAGIFSSTPEYLYWSEIVIRNGNWATAIIEIPAIITSLLQAMKKGNQSTAISIIVQFLPLPIIAGALYASNKTDLGRIIYCYPIQAVFGVLVSIPFAYFALREVIRAHKASLIANEEGELEEIANKDGSEKINDEIDSEKVNSSLKMDQNGNKIEEFQDKVVATNEEKGIAEL
ncbi:MatE family protein [Tritrichomonas foetus]|uniref:MatE family protein n=1 Tax=Tritrichomonas foetus TaxID=1144522 RepID=A0A1J4K872_9EUKA|nr:MatE family protein [Tritrichomonas foetus]|eukprot:OHT07697.1 MatE family protein [Tritrichomonas foetus]